MLVEKLFNKNKIKKINKKILLLGTNTKFNATDFLGVRLSTSIFFFVLIFCNFKYGYILSIIFVVLYYYLFEYILLDKKICEREKKINDEAIYFFEVLTLSLQTGRNLSEALKITTEAVDSDLSFEFKRALNATKIGRSLTESLNDMQSRIPSDSVNNIILALTQSNVYGSSIISTLKNQIDYLREKRKMEIKNAINKIPVKISIISVLFFIPLILLIVIAPVLLNYINM